MYLLPKIHKRLENVPERPAIPNYSTTTEKVSEFLGYHLKPDMQRGRSYIKDSGDFLKKIKDLGSLPENAILVRVDVVGIYPSIPHEAGLQALEEALGNRNHKQIPTEKLLKMAQFVLKNNFSEFNNDVFQQISGTAIGTKFTLPYACIFMDQIETNFLRTQSHQPMVWFRYIDDIFFIWTHGEEKPEEFMADFNAFNLNIQFTYESSKKSIAFLDLDVALNNGTLDSNVHVKPTDRHQYLLYSSSHPEHTKRSITFSQILRVSRISSREKDFQDFHCLRIRSWFLKRKYPEKLIDKEMKKVRFFPANLQNKKREKGVPFVVTYHPILNSLSKIIRDNMYLLNINEEVRKTFSPVPMVSFQSARKLSSYLVRAKLYPLERKVGSSKCGKRRCEVCNTHTLLSN